MKKYTEFVRKEVRELEYPEYADSESSSHLAGDYIFSQDKELLAKISKHIGIDAKKIVITSGCDGGLQKIAQTFISKGDKILIPCPTFGRYEFHTKLMGGKPVFVYFDEPFEFNLEKLKDIIEKEDVKLIFLCNPNNPTGHYISGDKIENFVKDADCIVVIDEALADYIGKSSANLIEKYPNVLIARTFSKFFQLANLRIGYIAAPDDLIPYILRTVSPFEVSSHSIEMAKKSFDIKNKVMKRAPMKLMKKTDGIQGVDGDGFRGLEGKGYVRVCKASQNKNLKTGQTN
ncbi:MAG: histidinol-phosphate aminotransferase family protein [Candidatus Aenigmarchaeota archaeon]|nr:histidinol-phosphate aminotransferase family protein [Candidatus Aenigmarchaeota archaeon]